MVKTKAYVPERGDLVWLNFSPREGHEQAGRRPAIVVSPKAYNQRLGLALFCPVTSQIKGYPFEVAVLNDSIKGVVLCDQVKNLDWKARKIKYIARLSQDNIEDILAKLMTLLE